MNHDMINVICMKTLQESITLHVQLQFYKIRHHNFLKTITLDGVYLTVRPLCVFIHPFLCVCVYICMHGFVYVCQRFSIFVSTCMSYALSPLSCEMS